MINNQMASKYDLYLPGELVAALHYKLDADKNEVMFIYCEAIETKAADRHRQEIMRRTLDDVRSRRLKLTVTCPIALNAIAEARLAAPSADLTTPPAADRFAAPDQI